jgi:SAM-dependent methyltransferase
MNIRPNDFVLEIGSGHNPSTRSDILCDKFIGDDTQRGGNIVTDRPIVEADGQYLPFADAAFDYVICSHVLEHVEDPELLISELMRVASRGYIETPSEIAERLYGWPYHNWIINLIDGRLTIQKKVTKDQFGQLFHALAAHDRYFTRFHVTHHNIFLVQYEWVGRIDYHILPPDTSSLDLELPQTIEAMLNQVDWIPFWKKWLSIVKNAIPRQIVFKAKSFLVKQRRRPKKTLQEIVVCPVCKQPVKWKTNEICCGHCSVTYPIIRGIPQLLPPT